MPASEAQKRATEKYLEKFDTLRIRVERDMGIAIKEHAKNLGMSLNAYIVSLIKKDMEQ